LEVAGPAGSAEATTLGGRIETVLRMDGGTLRLEQAKVTAAGNVATLQATVPLGALARVIDGLDAFAVAPADGPISVTVSSVDLETLRHLFERPSKSNALFPSFEVRVGA